MYEMQGEAIGSAAYQVQEKKVDQLDGAHIGITDCVILKGLSLPNPAQGSCSEEVNQR